MKTLRILAVDDHEMTMLGYKFILERIVFDNYNILVDTANSYEAGKEKIEDSASSFPYDILLLDVQLFPPNESQPHNGEELGKLARQLVPHSRIIYMSSFSDNYRINTILQSVNPEGYMVKTDIDPITLEDAIKTVSKGDPYYSAKALNAVRRKMSNSFDLDEKDRKILYHLSVGTRTKDLEQHVDLSPSAIENRKRSLKKKFETENQNAMALILAAKNRGFL